MSNEKLGRIKVEGREMNMMTSTREAPGINLPTDFMTEEEIQELSGEVVKYRKEK